MIIITHTVTCRKLHCNNYNNYNNYFIIGQLFFQKCMRVFLLLEASSPDPSTSTTALFFLTLPAAGSTLPPPLLFPLPVLSLPPSLPLLGYSALLGLLMADWFKHSSMCWLTAELSAASDRDRPHIGHSKTHSCEDVVLVFILIVILLLLLLLLFL